MHGSLEVVFDKSMVFQLVHRTVRVPAGCASCCPVYIAACAASWWQGSSGKQGDLQAAKLRIGEFLLESLPLRQAHAEDMVENEP